MTPRLRTGYLIARSAQCATSLARLHRRIFQKGAIICEPFSRTFFLTRIALSAGTSIYPIPPEIQHVSCLALFEGVLSLIA